MPTLIHDPSQIDFDQPGKHHYQVAFHLDGAWGYSLVPLTVVNGRRGSNSNGVLVFGGTHGNEYEGQIAVKRWCQDLNADELSGRVVLMPQLSESACIANTRVSPLDGVNMNRAFPGDPRGTISHAFPTSSKPEFSRLAESSSIFIRAARKVRFQSALPSIRVANPAQQAEMAHVARLFRYAFRVHLC